MLLSTTTVVLLIVGVPAGVPAGDDAWVECTQDGPASPFNWVQPDPDHGGVWVFQPERPPGNNPLGPWDGTYHFVGPCEV